MHGLIHLANDVRKHGELDSFSAFKFENHLGSIKKLLKSQKHPLQQIHRRIVERFETINFSSLGLISESTQIQPKAGTIIHEGFIYKAKSPNNIVLLKNGDIIQITDICLENQKVVILGNVCGRDKSI